MPNQRSPDKVHTSITLHKDLMAKIDKIAVNEDRSRNKIIEILLMKQVDQHLSGQLELRPNSLL